MAQDESNALNCKQSLLFDVLRARKKNSERKIDASAPWLNPWVPRCTLAER